MTHGGAAGLVTVTATLAVALTVWAAGERLTEADIARCAEVARAAIPSPAYDDPTAASPLPGQMAGVSGYTGPITLVEPWILGAPAPPPGMRSPAFSGVFGAGGYSQAASSDPGALDPRRRETFHACLRAALLERTPGPLVGPR